MKVYVVVLNNYTKSETEVVGVFYDLETAQQVVKELKDETKGKFDVFLDSKVVLF